MREFRTQTGVALGLVATLLGLGLASRILVYPLGHDEHMFVPAGVLLGDSALYSELNYNHLPNFPLLLHALYGLTGTSHYLLTGRLVVVGCWFVLAAAAWLVARRLGAGPGAAGLVLLLLATNNVLLDTVGMLATNNLAPVAAAVAGVWLLFTGLDGPAPRRGPLFLAGLCLALAAGLKANYLFVILPTTLAATLVPRAVPLRDRLRCGLVPFALGGIAGATPTLYYLLSRPAAFLFNSLTYHTGPSIAWRNSPEAADAGLTGLTLASKLLYAWDLWLSGTTLLAIAAGACLAAYLLERTGLQGGLDRLRDWRILVVLGCATLGVLVSFVPTPAYPHYYAPPVAFLVLLIPCLWGQLGPAERAAARPLLAGFAATALAVGGPRLLKDLPEIAHPAQWTGMRVHATGEQLAAQLAELGPGVSGPLATLTPIYPLEGGIPVYRELADGPFFFRVGEFISPEERARHGVLSASDLDAFLNAQPPAGVYVGFEGALDASFADWALRRGWHRIGKPIGRDRYGEGTLWLPSTSNGTASKRSAANLPDEPGADLVR